MGKTKINLESYFSIEPIKLEFNGFLIGRKISTVIYTANSSLITIELSTLFANSVYLSVIILFFKSQMKQIVIVGNIFFLASGCSQTLDVMGGYRPVLHIQKVYVTNYKKF